MNTVKPSRLLRGALLADALVSAGAAALQLLPAGAVAELTGLPRPLLAATGAFLLVYVALLLVMARSTRLWSTLVLLVVIGNAGWALGCLALAIRWALPAPGTAWLLVQAVAVLAFALLQWRGLAASPAATPAAGAALRPPA